MNEIQDQSFRHFPDLPTELRVQIWRETLTQSWRDETQPERELPVIFFYDPRAFLWQVGTVDTADDKSEESTDESAALTPSSIRAKPKVRLQFEHWRLDKHLIKTPIIASVNREARAVVLDWASKQDYLKQASPGKDSNADHGDGSNVKVHNYGEEDGDDCQSQSEIKIKGKTTQQQHASNSDQRCIFARRFNRHRDVLFVSVKQIKFFLNEPKILSMRTIGDVPFEESGFGVRSMIISVSALESFRLVDFVCTKLERLYVCIEEIPHESRESGDGQLIMRKHWTYATHEKKGGKPKFAPFVWNKEHGQFETDLESYSSLDVFWQILNRACEGMAPHLARQQITEFKIWPVTTGALKSS